MHPTYERGTPGRRPYALDALRPLPCGCVAGVYRARASDVEVVAVEARGPHCLHANHHAGRVIGLGSTEESGWLGG